MGERVWLEQTGRVRITLGEILENSVEFAQLKQNQPRAFIS